jgi:ribonuclease HII
MRNLHRHYPHYGFAEHVGYATAAHRRVLALFSVPVHITGVPSGSGRKMTDPLSKKVSKELSLDIL